MPHPFSNAIMKFRIVFFKMAALGALLLGGLFVTPLVLAEGGCQPGFVLRSINKYGDLGCVPHGTPHYQDQQRSPQQAPAAPPPPQRYRSDSMVAVVSHPEASGVWAVWNERSRERAESRALNACKKVMGEGCTVFVSAYNGTVVIGRDQNGNLWEAFGKNSKHAADELYAACAAKGKLCKIVRDFIATPHFDTEGRGGQRDNSLEYEPPNTPELRNRIGATAWTDAKAGPKWSNTVWGSGGHKTIDEAGKAAVAKCEQDSGAKCTVAGVSINGYIAVLRDNLNQLRNGVDMTEADAEKQGMRKCKTDEVTCHVAGMLNAKIPGAVAINTLAAAGGK